MSTTETDKPSNSLPAGAAVLGRDGVGALAPGICGVINGSVVVKHGVVATVDTAPVIEAHNKFSLEIANGCSVSAPAPAAETAAESN